MGILSLNSCLGSLPLLLAAHLGIDVECESAHSLKDPWRIVNLTPFAS